MKVDILYFIFTVDYKDYTVFGISIFYLKNENTTNVLQYFYRSRKK